MISDGVPEKKDPILQAKKTGLRISFCLGAKGGGMQMTYMKLADGV